MTRDSERRRTYAAEHEARRVAVVADPPLPQDDATTLVHEALDHLTDAGYPVAPDAPSSPTIEFVAPRAYTAATSWRYENRVRFCGAPTRDTVLHEVTHLRVPDHHPGHGIAFRHLLLRLNDEFTPAFATCLREAFDDANLLHVFDERRAAKVRAHAVWLFNRALAATRPGPGSGSSRAQTESRTAWLHVVTTPLRDVDTGAVGAIQFSGQATVDSSFGVTFAARAIARTTPGKAGAAHAAPLSLPWDHIAYVDGLYK